MAEYKGESPNTSLISMNDDDRKLLLDILDFEVDEKGFIVDKKTKRHYICPVSNTKFQLVHHQP